MSTSIIEPRNIRIFVLLSQGRSGTQFLAELLGKDVEADVHHEPCREDYKYLPLAWSGAHDHVCAHYLDQRFRRQLSAVPPGRHKYGEANSLLRYHSLWLQHTLCATVVHVHRDGRDFVSSVFSRSAYTESDPHSPIVPKDGDPAAAQWGKWNRFQKLCWYWASANQHLLQTVSHRAALELAITDYDYFSERILLPTGTRISSAMWEQEIRQPKNATRHGLFTKIRRWRSGHRPADSIPRWRSWSAELTSQFWEICGNTMSELGYSRLPR